MKIEALFKLREEIFQIAENHGCVPVINESGILLMYYQENIPSKLNEEINLLMGMKLLNDEQFIEVTDCERFKELQEKIHGDGILSPDFVFFCQSWMRTLKHNNAPCMKEWGDLTETNENNKRFCDQCNKSVYHIESIEELKRHLAARHCIAFRLADDSLSDEELDKLDIIDDNFEFVGDP